MMQQRPELPARQKSIPIEIYRCLASACLVKSFMFVDDTLMSFIFVFFSMKFDGCLIEG